MNCGVKLNNINVSILMYADDMVQTANSEEDLQRILNHMFKWCRKWRLKVNILKLMWFTLDQIKHGNQTLTLNTGMTLLKHFQSTNTWVLFLASTFCLSPAPKRLQTLGEESLVQ